MPKLKTKKTLKKRIKISGTGKVMVGHGNNGHLKRKYSANKKNRKKGYKEIENSAVKNRLRKLLGKGGRGIKL